MKELINKIRIKINDTSSFEFSDNELISYINDGITYLENVMVLNKVKFNISLLTTSLSVCPVPEDMLAIYKVISYGKEIPLKEVYSKEAGYYILNNNIILPYADAEIYYIKEYERVTINDKINLPKIFINYLYLYTISKALSRLEFNMEAEEKEMLNIINIIVKNMLHQNGSHTLNRYNEYML